MLKDAPWLRIGRDIKVEFDQSLEEGRDVEKYRGTVDAMCKLDDDSLRKNESIISSLADKIRNSPMRADYPYTEPSDWNGIVSESSATPVTPYREIPDEILLDKLAGAWIGRISGCLLGKPVEGWRRDKLYPVLKATDNYPMKRYICQNEFTDELVNKYHIWRGACFADNVKNGAPVDDDTNYTTFALKLVETYGKDFTPCDVMTGWLSWIPIFATCTAERAAYRNAACGMLPPETATYNNPYREWIGAQIRGDFYGYINPGNPAKAAEMAFRDASISHVKNGIYGEIYVSAMIAQAAVTTEIKEIISIGLSYIPKKSRLAEKISFVTASFDRGLTAEEMIDEIHTQYNEYSAHDWCSTVANAMIVTMALLWGRGDFGQSICLAVQAAFDTDCNGATVGSILGIMLGESAIDPYWYRCYGKVLHTSIDGYNVVDVKSLAEKTLALLRK